jgi:hypothetical protein
VGEQVVQSPRIGHGEYVSLSSLTLTLTLFLTLLLSFSVPVPVPVPVSEASWVVTVLVELDQEHL